MLIDSIGDIRASYTYGLWGERSKLWGSLDTESGFTGYRHHVESGLEASLTRMYNAQLGRFVSRDILAAAELIQGTNLYTYAHNNPVNRIDVSGLADSMPRILQTDQQRQLARDAFGGGAGATLKNPALLNKASMRDLGVLAHNARKGINLANSEKTLATQTARLAATEQAIAARGQRWGPLAPLAPAVAYYAAIGGAPVQTAFILAPLESTLGIGLSAAGGWFLGREFMQLSLYGDGKTLDDEWTEIFQEYYWDWWYGNCP